MSFIKKTNVVSERIITKTLKKVQCPYCKIFLEPIPEYITAMKCWKCNKEFRIEQEQDKIIQIESSSVTKTTRKLRL